MSGFKAQYLAAAALVVGLATDASAAGFRTMSPETGVRAAAYSQTVRDLQAELNARGYDAGPVDGQMGRRTSDAIRSYQSKNGLLATGQPSEALLEHVRRQPLPKQPEPEPAPASKPETAAAPSGQILKIERGLEARGYDVGPIDGVLDDRARNAIRAYQRDSGAVVDGEPSAELAKQLGEGLPADLNTRENIRTVQSGLNARGYSAGPADGVMGPSTRRAMQAYRRDQGLPAAEGVTAELLESLEKTPVAAAKPKAPEKTEPVMRRVFRDDFTDGNFTSNPAWRVAAGTFSVTDGALTTAVPSLDKPQSAEDVGGALLRGVLGQTLGVDLGGGRATAAIYQPSSLPDAFEIRTTVAATAADLVRMHLGPYQKRDVSVGYRLVFDEKANDRLAIVARADGASRTVAKRDGMSSLADGKPHEIVWKRSQDGRMHVSVDGAEVLNVVDQSVAGGFEGYSFVALGGGWRVGSVEVSAIE